MQMLGILSTREIDPGQREPPVTTTTTKKTSAAAPVLETTEKIQDSIVELVKGVTSRFSDMVPEDVGELLSKPADLIEKAFDFTTDIIETQRDFVLKLVKNATPSKN